MTVGWIVQIVVDFSFLALLLTMLVRQMKKPKEDPRLSRGLQLLQSKISVLEDLSDRTEVQVRQLNSLLEQKSKAIDEKIAEADRKLANIDHSIEKSLEVAEIFQDRIPHKEIIERQSLNNYVKAARLAHQGHSIDQIARQVDLPTSEIEFIAKVNRERLLFTDDQLPAWIQDNKIVAKPNPSNLNSEPGNEAAPSRVDKGTSQRAMIETQSYNGISRPFSISTQPGESLPELGRRFREACNDFDQKAEEPRLVEGKVLSSSASGSNSTSTSPFGFERFNPHFLLTKLEEKLHSPQSGAISQNGAGDLAESEMSDNF